MYEIPQLESSQACYWSQPLNSTECSKPCSQVELVKLRTGSFHIDIQTVLK